MKTLPIDFLPKTFDLRDGKIFWRSKSSRHNTRKLGQQAGSVDALGYRRVMISGIYYYEHRVIFAMTHGRWPVGDLDHANRNTIDNRPENLREATDSQNMANRPRVFSNNTSGMKGLTWNASAKKWRTRIGYRGKRIWLGQYGDFELAKFIYECAAEKYFGAFARPAP